MIKYGCSRWPESVLGILLIVDIFFILIHSYTIVFWNMEPEVLLLDANGFGFPEAFQYLKYLGVMGLIAYLIVYIKRYAYLPLFVLFTFLLINDVLQLHRLASWFFVDYLNLKAKLGFKAMSIGQLIYAVTMGLFFLSLSLWHYSTAALATRKSFLDIFKLLCVFLFFGVGVDVVQAFFEAHNRASLILTIVEEGGEMITLSMLVWCFCRLAAKQNTIQKH